MGLRDRLEARAAALGESALNAAASVPDQVSAERFRGLRSIFQDGEQPLSVERFLGALVGAVRADERDEDRSARDVYVKARKRRRRLGLISFGAGPLVGFANQLVDLYCETATVQDIAAFHDLPLTDEEVGAHMLVLWRVIGDYGAALGAMGGDPPIANILAGRLAEKAGEHLPERLTKRSVTKALWDLREAVDGVGGSKTDAIGGTVFAGHRTKKLIERVEAQLGTGAEDSVEGIVR